MILISNRISNQIWVQIWEKIWSSYGHQLSDHVMGKIQKETEHPIYDSIQFRREFDLQVHRQIREVE